MYHPGGPIGDRAGEPLHTHRGGYSAWAYVVVAFIFEVMIVGGTLGLVPALGVGALLREVAPGAEDAGLAAAVFGFGTLGAYLIFRDRWRCIEAVSSRYCSGLANLSMLYVPVIAFVYANYRGIQKLRRR